MGVVHRSTTQNNVRTKILIHRDQSNQILHKSSKMSKTPAKIKSKYADVNTEPDFDNPKWLARHKHMFNFLDVNKNGKISLDELVFKANTEICEAIKATPEHRKKQPKCLEDFFGGAGLKYGVETHWPEYIEGWKKLATEELRKWKNEEETLIRRWGDCLFEIIDKDGSGTITEMNGFITPNVLASFKIKKMRKGPSKFATSIKVES